MDEESEKSTVTLDHWQCFEFRQKWINCNLFSSTWDTPFLSEEPLKVIIYSFSGLPPGKLPLMLRVVCTCSLYKMYQRLNILWWDILHPSIQIYSHFKVSSDKHFYFTRLKEKHFPYRNCVAFALRSFKDDKTSIYKWLVLLCEGQSEVLWPLILRRSDSFLQWICLLYLTARLSSQRTQRCASSELLSVVLLLSLMLSGLCQL